MMALSDHAQLKSVYGVSRVMCHREPGPPIFMSKVRGPGVEASEHLVSFPDNLHDLLRVVW